MMFHICGGANWPKIAKIGHLGIPRAGVRLYMYNMTPTWNLILVYPQISVSHTFSLTSKSQPLGLENESLEQQQKVI